MIGIEQVADRPCRVGCELLGGGNLIAGGPPGLPRRVDLCRVPRLGFFEHELQQRLLGKQVIACLLSFFTA